ncbi:MAG: hypothetical protein WCI73_10150 [Phycisphaerae bacterium]
MNKDGEDKKLPITLEYASANQTARFGGARFLLMLWMVLSILVTPLGLIIGVGGSFVAITAFRKGIDPAWNYHSIEDWIGFVLWVVNIPELTVVPALGAILCGVCRNRLGSGDITGAYLAERICRWALRTGALLALGLLYGLSKALLHGRWQEINWWIGVLFFLSSYGVAVEYTRRIMRRIMIAQIPEK